MIFSSGVHICTHQAQIMRNFWVRTVISTQSHCGKKWSIEKVLEPSMWIEFIYEFFLWRSYLHTSGTNYEKFLCQNVDSLRINCFLWQNVFSEELQKNAQNLHILQNVHFLSQNAHFLFKNVWNSEKFWCSASECWILWNVDVLQNYQDHRILKDVDTL